MASGHYEEARKQLDALLVSGRSAAEHEEAMYLEAVALTREQKWASAFEAFQEFSRAFPVSRYSPQVEKELFQMGNALIRGEGAGFLGIPRWLGLTTTGTDVLLHLIKISPTGQYADHAQRIIAQYYFENADFQMAQLEYQVLLTDYPDSVFRPLAEYRVPFCRYKQSRGARYDRKILEDALKGFREYDRRHPGGDWSRQALTHAREVLDMLAEKNYLIADFYLADKRYGPSVFYFKQTIQEYPETSWAVRSMERLKDIVDDYAGTAAARMARDYLEMIGK